MAMASKPKPMAPADTTPLTRDLAAMARQQRTMPNTRDMARARVRSFLWQQQLWGDQQAATPAARGITMGVDSITLNGKTYYASRVPHRVATKHAGRARRPGKRIQ